MLSLWHFLDPCLILMKRIVKQSFKRIQDISQLNNSLPFFMITLSCRNHDNSLFSKDYLWTTCRRGCINRFCGWGSWFHFHSSGRRRRRPHLNPRPLVVWDSNLPCHHMQIPLCSDIEGSVKFAWAFRPAQRLPTFGPKIESNDILHTLVSLLFFFRSHSHVYCRDMRDSHAYCLDFVETKQWFFKTS